MLSAPAGRRFTTRAVAKRNDVGPRTVERWERDPRLNFPRPTYVRGRKYWDELTKRRLKRGVFCSVIDLQEAINRFIAETNASPKPFVWTADPKRVLAAVSRGKQALESIH